MKKPNPITLVALCIAAIAILAFTLNEEFGKKKASASVVATKNTNIITPIVATNPPHGQPGHRHDLPDGAPLPNNSPTPAAATPSTNLPLNSTPSQPANNTTEAVNLNPAHGQPGHNCDIPVGAPLNSTAVKPSQPVISNNQTISSGKNPAHGQPGHRCDIAVGAPLNSAPAKTTTSPAVANNSTITASTNNTVANGLNPAHGQPGHRCDIAVGASLSSPKNETPAASATQSNTGSPSLFPNYNFPIKDSVTTAP